jgi:hypothetical protein
VRTGLVLKSLGFGNLYAVLCWPAGWLALVLVSSCAYAGGGPFGIDHEWQAIDSSAISAVGAQLLKYAFSRARPSQGDNPNKWLQGGCCESFPSGEVTLQASFVTPFIANYAKQDPWVFALEVLPLYDSIARLKSQAHWQSDVIVGWALGTAVGYWTRPARRRLRCRSCRAG